MDETIEWLRGRPYYGDQIQTHTVLEGQAASTRSLKLDNRVRTALDSQGISTLYEHQAAAIEAVRAGDNVVLATPTASGKSLAYTVPSLERALDHGGTTLYIGPQVALINDQEETLQTVAGNLGFGHPISVEQYTGRLSKTEKQAVREQRPTTILTTPDMLHYSLLPFSRRLWEWFFDNLNLVVIDEVHEYRGVFGSHVGLVLRRLARICENFDSDPQFICCSATIGNPIEHASIVTGQPEESLTLVDTDASASGDSHWLFWNPPEYSGGTGFGERRSSHVETMNLFVDLVQRGYQTVVFTRARQTAERYATESSNELRDRGEDALAGKIGAYQAALPTSRREALEDGLHSGEIRGVWSTNALELGVDIGGLDAVLLDGYPGTRMQTYQQAGRAGRGEEASLVVLVAGEDQLDQYMMTHPEDFFDGKPERAVANPGNEHLLPDHICSAATESWLRMEDETHFGESFPDIVSDLEESNQLDRRTTANGLRWIFSGEGSPQHEMSLRTIGDREIRLRDRRSDEIIARLPFEDGLRDAHPGAVYHHQGTTYEVVNLDLERNIAELDPIRAQYFTQILHEKAITVDADLQEKRLSTHEDVTVRFAEITMHKQITGFERHDTKSGETLGRETLDLPETTLETKALYFTVPRIVEHEIRGLDGSFPGAIHAAEHGMIALFPLQLVCDRRDIGGLSTPEHAHTGVSTIFIYDGFPGGVGLSKTGYDRIEKLMDDTRGLIGDCGCESGCPACIQSPHCGNANNPLYKEGAFELLSLLLDR